MTQAILESPVDAIALMLLEQQDDAEFLDYDDISVSSMEYDFSSY